MSNVRRTSLSVVSIFFTCRHSVSMDSNVERHLGAARKSRMLLQLTLQISCPRRLSANLRK